MFNFSAGEAGFKIVIVLDVSEGKRYGRGTVRRFYIRQQKHVVILSLIND